MTALPLSCARFLTATGRITIRRRRPGQRRARLGIAENVYVYGCLGSCKPYKNLEMLITAFKECSDGCALLIAGQFQSTEHLATIRDRLSRLPADKVHFEPRFIPDEEISDYMLACDALVLPYKEILTSGSVLLASSFGRPVVAPDIGGLRDAVNSRSAILYDARDPEGLRRAMQAVRNERFDEQEIIAGVRSMRWIDAALALEQCPAKHGARRALDGVVQGRGAV